MLRGNVPIAKMVENIPSAGARLILRTLGRVLVPKIRWTSLFLREGSTELLRALRRDPLADGCKVVYIGGANSLESIESLLRDGFDGVQMGRALLREPYFVRRLQRGVREREQAAKEGRAPGPAAVVTSKCVHINLCTLASLNEKIKPGCALLKPDDFDIEEPPPCRDVPLVVP